MTDVCIIGAGPAGLLAAAEIASAGMDCLLLEKMEKTGRKLRITGKGRCNLTNTREDFLGHIEHGGDFVATALERFSPKDTVAYFESIGVRLVTERGGRVFPESGKAWDIAQAMVDHARAKGASVRCEAKVTAIVKKDLFEIAVANGSTIRCKKVLIATGGASYPSTGSTGDGYTFAWKLGHTIIPLRPALTHIEIKGKPEQILLRNCNVKMEIGGNIESEEFGEVEFSDRGLAGAAVLPLSLRAIDAYLENRGVAFILDLKPALSREQIIRRCKVENTGNCKDLIRKFLPWQMTAKIASQCGIKLKDPFPESLYGKLADTMKGLRFEMTGYGDFNYAIVTAGGVSTQEVDEKTMESKLCSGLYFAGEVLDIDGRTGGYNIQMALSTAHLASESICHSLK